MEHVAEHSLSYGTVEEFNFRQDIFNKVHEEIVAINSSPNMTHEVGHNFLSTWTTGEKKRLLGYNGLGEYKQATILEETNGNSINWIDEGAVNSVQNQASCGSCWSFSATAAVEAAHHKATGKLEKLSEEQLVQCSKRNNGCNGGSMALAFKFLESTAQVSEKQYPYTSGRGVTGSCDSSKSKGGDVKVTDYHNVT